MAAQPRIVTRREWGAATSIPGGRGVAPGSRRYFVVHWPVMSSRDERQWCRDIERIHRGNGWAAAPGYNYLVGQSGTIFEGCGRDVRGIHSPPRNTDGWGICVLQPSTGAGRPTAAISDAAKRSTRQLYEWLNTVAGRRLNMWWHGRDHATACPGPDLRAWVQAGMPAGAPAPAPQPQPPAHQEGNMNAAELAANGTLHMWSVGPQRRTVWLTTQRKGSTSWGGGQAGQRVAGLTRWADAPSGRTIVGISARQSDGGVLHFFATLDNGAVLYRFQRPNETSWNPGTLAAFAPSPI